MYVLWRVGICRDMRATLALSLSGFIDCFGFVCAKYQNNGIELSDIAIIDVQQDTIGNSII